MDVTTLSSAGIKALTLAQLRALTSTDIQAGFHPDRRAQHGAGRAAPLDADWLLH